MTTTVTPKQMWVVRCDQCHHRADHDNVIRAEADAQNHDDQHKAFAVTGRDLRGCVYDTDADGVPWAGVVTTAIEHAVAAGFQYLVWNGMVYPASVTALNWNHPLCRAEDVPDTVAARRAS